jgi:hypothetical protein
VESLPPPPPPPPPLLSLVGSLGVSVVGVPASEELPGVSVGVSKLVEVAVSSEVVVSTVVLLTAVVVLSPPIVVSMTGAAVGIKVGGASVRGGAVSVAV